MLDKTGAGFSGVEMVVESGGGIEIMRGRVWWECFRRVVCIASRGASTLSKGETIVGCESGLISARCRPVEAIVVAIVVPVTSIPGRTGCLERRVWRCRRAHR